ncbi:NRAMP family divalent metal transporter [Thalassotalea algicola]|uniref:NRAMP family divalent metal transporter n=1 Tax=Thalassotalea algicola TaxID=2716224 RepID=UPI001B7D5C36|nr:divalent metal cation transporter [Thalassotalea algicola]
MNLQINIQKIFQLLGPGIVWAATSIGVSHIVQSTRAGADYGFALIGFILLAHVIKYPFFLFGPKYAGLTGKSLLDGYKSVGNYAFYLFLSLTLITMFFVQAGVTIVTSALAMNLFGDLLSLSGWAGLILLVVCTVLIIGHYKLLNNLLKWMMLALAICSIIAWFAAVGRLGLTPSGDAPIISLTTGASIAFIVALVGWMPTAIEVSVWHSLWTLSRVDKPSKEAANNACIDFNIGYVTSLILALIFVSLGAMLMFGEGISFANSAAAFAGQLIGVYTKALGDWSWLLMAIITFVALFSTTFAVADGFPQVWRRAFTLVRSETNEAKANAAYIVTLLVLALGSWWIITYFSRNITILLDFVTTVSFVSAPIYGWLNYQVMMKSEIDESEKPQGIFKVYTLISLALLTLFSVFYLWWKFIG